MKFQIKLNDEILDKHKKGQSMGASKIVLGPNFGYEHPNIPP